LFGSARMTIDDFALARAVHVLALVHWIGVLPRARALPDARTALAAFEIFEGRFAAQVRFSILLAGLSGLYMLDKLQAWTRLLDPAFWWLALMVAVWAVFALMVFVLEPLVVHRLFHDYALRDKDRAFALAIRLHAVALVVSAVAIAAGVLGAHGALP
jgi:Na+/proline symporter